MSKIVSFLMVTLLVLTSQLDTFAAESQQFDVKSEAAVLLDSQTGAVLYAKHANERLYPASLTKIATAIYAIEKGNLDDMVTVSANAVQEEGTRVYLNVGEQVPLRKLIQGMLINSGNDAAVAIAEHLDGSVSSFAMNLNSYLKTKIGAKHTHFTNPNGLFNENHYTTAMDLALITNYAIKNPAFAEIFSTKELKWNGQSWNTTLITHHRMLKGEIPYPGITGGKTGFIDESKQTLATTADNGKMKLTAIEMKANNKKDIYNDTKELLDYGFNSFQNTVLSQSVIFKNGHRSFFTLNDTLITEPTAGSKKQVNKQGILSIRDRNNHVLETLHLQQYKEVNAVTKEHKYAANTLEHSSVIYGIGMLAIAGVFISLRKRISRKM